MQSIRTVLSHAATKPRRMMHILAAACAAMCLVTLLLKPQASAANAANGVKIVRVNAYRDGWAVVEISQSKGGAGCFSSTPLNYAFPINTDGGKGMLTLFTTAKLSASNVYISGTNSCGTGIFSTYELVDYVRLEP